MEGLNRVRGGLERVTYMWEVRNGSKIYIGIPEWEETYLKTDM
jgi:hypothetical protein